MKRLLCLILTLCVLISMSATALKAAAQPNGGAEISAEKFASEVSNLLSSQDSKNTLPDENNNSSINCESHNHDNFETARLIVKSKNRIDTLNSTAVISGYDDLWVLQFDNEHDAEEAYEYYSTRSGIEYVEADKEVILSVPNSPLMPIKADENVQHLSWGPAHVGFDNFNNQVIDAKAELTETVVAIVDTGVDAEHSFLKNRVIPTNINTSSSGKRNNSGDDHGHGTQIAGVIADCTLSSVYIKPYKVLDNKGKGTVITVAAGINCAVKDGVDVISVSIGFEENSDVLKSAIDNAEQNDITVVSAAGNDGSDTIYYPSSYSSVIKVSATNELNVLANFSSYGNGIDFAAPGVDIITTTLNNKFITVSGTSLSTPFVAAYAASILTVFPQASSEDVYDVMAANAISGIEYDKTEKFGNGIIHIPDFNKGQFPSAKTESPVFSMPDGFYDKEIDLEITCSTDNSVIYYTTDRSVPSKTNPNANVYDGTPLHFSQTAVVMAVAYSEGLYRSSISVFNSIIAPVIDESLISLDMIGNIVKYKGTATSITIPETVHGRTIKGVGSGAFANSNISEIILPKTVTSIGENAFSNCHNLKTVSGSGVTVIGQRAFYNCTYLRNPFLGELTSIGSYAFYGVCSRQYSLYERTFSLELEKLTSIPEGAFMNSAISNISLGEISSVGYKAFSECNALANISINNLSNLPDGAFKGCSSLSSVRIHGLEYVPTGAFSTCEDLRVVDIRDAKTIGSNAFESCESLVYINAQNAETVYSNAFSGCSMLSILSLPSMLYFEETVYNQQEPKILFPPNLEAFIAPKMTKTVTGMFKYAKNIKYIYLNSVTEIAEYTFRELHDIYLLNIESAESLGKNALAYCSIQFIDARSLKTTEDLPDNSGILLSNTFIESTDIANNLTVYGTPDTFVERYAKHKGYNFVGIPLIINKLPEYITANSETVYILAIGFDLQYQWYQSTDSSTENGTPIEGATMSSYTFTDADKAPFYYCVITQTDAETVSTITTSIIVKDTNPADYSDYNAAVAEAKAVNRNLYENIYILDEILQQDVSGRYSCEQDIVDNQTQAIRNAIAALKLKKVNTLTLTASTTDLTVFESVKLIPDIQPVDVPFESIEWSSNNRNVVLVSKDGLVRCIGNGTAIIYAHVRNTDGTIVSGQIIINCNLTLIERILAFFFSPLFILNHNFNN
ncbi:MAG: leucine-rich repeat protein [Clostridia bacterium]|nr:leucine-rich repeat protein [Clostridia bacterium]